MNDGAYRNIDCTLCLNALFFRCLTQYVYVALMASSKAPKHDFAPAWLKIPDEDSQVYYSTDAATIWDD